jgi:hypothetical protein
LTRKGTSTSASSMATGRRQWRKRAATILDERGHKHLKGDKVVAFCDRNCNVIAPFIAAPGNRNSSPLLKEALPQVDPHCQAGRTRPEPDHRQLGWGLR